MNQHADHEQQREKLWQLIKDVRIAMLTTVDNDGTLRSRPMATQQSEFDGNLWFFTWADSPKVAEAQEHHQVNVSYADPDNQHYVSVSGTATLVRERSKMEELWNPFYRTWFPEGLDDPNLALLKVHIEKAEYWDSPSSAVVHLFGLAKATVTGKPPQPGENEKLRLDEQQAGGMPHWPAEP